MTAPGHLSDDPSAPGGAGIEDPLDEAPASAGAPPVVAVVVTHDPGAWLEEALTSLGAQDYPSLSVLVLDAASAEDPTTRIAAVLPTAFVRRLPANDGFGPTANDVLNVVEGASHFVFLHDDVVLESDAVRLLVEEAYRSNAGVVAPKVVAWDDPLRLLAVGGSADKAGHVVVYGRGELDQEQHDAVRDVFIAPGGCQLVRADLFATLQGFDPAISLLGDDLDLCWRAQVAGARVVVAPGARVRHMEATRSLERPVDVSAADGLGKKDEPAHTLAGLEMRHRLRTVLVGYGRLHALRIVPQALVLMIVEAVTSPHLTVRDVFDAWSWNLRSIGDLRAARKRLRAIRLLPDRDVRRLQTRGGARVIGLLRGGVAVEERTLGVGAAGRELAGAITKGGTRLTVTVWLTLAAVLLVGSRHLIGGPIPAVGQLVPFPHDPWDTLRTFIAGWTPSGLGSTGPPPFAHFLLGLGGTLLLGSEQLLQKVLVLGCLPVGIVGMHRLTAPVGSWRARLVAAVLYAAVPLPYDALARGRWAPLVAYAVMPWLTSRLLRSTGIAPFGAPAEAELSRRRRRRTGPRTAADAVEALLGAEAGTFDQVDTEELRVAAIAVAGRHDDTSEVDEPAVPPAAVRHPGTFVEQVVPAAILVALAAALAPPVVLALLVTGIALVVACAVVGPVRSGVDALGLAAVAAGGALVLLVPWSLELVAPGSPWAGVAGSGIDPADAPGFGEILAFHLGHLPLAPLGWGILVAAVLPVAIGRRWRAEWAMRFWIVAVVAWVVAWAAGRGWLAVPPPAVDVLLTPAAVAVVVAAALGLASFEIDLPGYHFGWRQVAGIAAGAASVVATLPGLAAAVDGRWRMPARDFEGLLSWMPEEVAKGDFRVMWVGAPDSLPLDGWRQTDGLAYGTSRNGAPDASSLWPGTDTGTTGLLADALAVARRGETTRVGQLLGPLGVRYIAIPKAIAPGPRRTAGHAPPQVLLDALRSQVDLRLIQSDDHLVLFENAAWRPIRAVGTQPVLDPGSPVLRSSGPVPAGKVVVAESYSDRWRLEVAGEAAPHAKADRWANEFTVATAGEGTLRYRTPPLRYLLLLVELALWAVAIRIAIRTVRRRAAALAPDANAAATEAPR